MSVNQTTVLVVDDSPENVEVLERILRRNYRVIVANNGARALAMARGAHPPDLILLDVMMPDMDGFEVCRRLKSDSVMRKIPVIFVTAKDEIEDERLGFDLGAVDYITKPVSASIVEARVRNHLALYDNNRLLEQRVEERTRSLTAINLDLERSVREREQAMSRADFMVSHDPLTTLPNRRHLLDQIAREHDHAQRNGGALAVLSINLDRFHSVNSALGPAVGDALLAAVPERLAAFVPNSGLLGRAGPDQFMLLLPGGDQGPQGLAQNAEDIARAMLAALAEPFALGDKTVQITARAGYAVYPSDGDSATSLTRNVETTLIYAKSAGGNRLERYRASLDSGAQARYELEARLRQGLQQRRLQMYYQPKVALGSNRILGAEALIRWPRDGGGFVSPSEFIPLAEDTGLSDALDQYVLRQVFADAAHWRTRLAPGARIAMNLSALQFRNENLVDQIRRALTQYGADPEQLELEITEGALIGDMGVAVAKLKALRELGLHLALDDFGTGYSSLSYLKRLPLDTLKIDQSFVRDIQHDANDAAIVRAIAMLAQSLSLSTVAEGVEQQAQLDFVQQQGCSIAQGFLFSPAVEGAHFEQMLKQGTLAPGS